MNTQISHQPRWRSAVISGVVATALVLTGCGSDKDNEQAEHTGSDAHEHIDPVADDPVIAATAVATSWLSYDPADRVSPCDIPDNVAMLQLTGELADTAATPDSRECMDARPKQWDDWGEANAQIKAIITDTEVIEETESEATVGVTVTQNLVYPDGGTSTWATSSHELTLVADDGRWKADSIKETSA